MGSQRPLFGIALGGAIAIACALLISPAGLLYAEEYSGVGSFWELGMGARPLALGEAFTGIADDGSALFYNPAGLAWIRNTGTPIFPGMWRMPAPIPFRFA